LAKTKVNIFQACTEVSLISCSAVEDLFLLGKLLRKTEKEKRGWVWQLYLWQMKTQ